MFPFADSVPRLRAPVVTYLLVIVNAWMFMFSLRLPEPNRDLLSFKHGFVPARLEQLVDPQPIFKDVTLKFKNRRTGEVLREVKTIPLMPDRQQIVLTLFSYMFMHGSWLHLIGNMWMLWIFGDNVEDRLGHVGFLIFYLLGGIVAALGHWAYNMSDQLPVIGASGAVAAVLGAYAVTWPWARVKTFVMIIIFVTIIDVPALIVHGVWFLSQLLYAHEAVVEGREGGVAYWAHIAGFLYGALLMPWIRNDEPPRDPAVIDVKGAADGSTRTA